MTEKNFLTKTLTNSVLSRRSFLKWSAALGGTAALAGGLNFGLKKVAAAAQSASTGQWVMAACWHNCGGRCANQAYVVDGVVTKQKTDDTHPDSPNYPQMRSCARGKSQRHQVFGVDRLKYPMKRANWTPGGGDKSLRGKDTWVRISWDEALTLVATETKRIQQAYGNKAILGSNRVLNAFGGGVPSWGQVSAGAWPEPIALMSGGTASPNDRMDYRNTKLLVLWGSNPIWSSGGTPTYNYLQAKKAGAKIIVVTPQYNETSQGLADEWIPVRPSTDAALLIGMAYHMITNNLQDQEFLDKYTVGFDSTHMPAGTYYKDNFKDYVLGTYDGVPKTPEWAANICGTNPDTIRKFAQEIATTKPMMFSSSWAPGRTYLGSQMCQAFLTVGWMTGNLGISGGNVVNIGHSGASYGGPALVSGGGNGVKSIANPVGGSYGIAHNDLTRKDVFCIVWDELWDAVLNGSFNLPGHGKQTVDIKMIWNIGDGSGGNNLNQDPNITKGIQAYRKVDFVVSNDIVLSSKSKYADIVLPVTTPWEKEGGGLLSMAGGEAMLFYSQVTQPLYEAQDEYWINRELAKRLGLDPEVVDPLSLKQRAFNTIAGSKVIKADASGYETLVTITADDIAKWGVDGKPQDGRISLSDFQAQGEYQVARAPGDNFTYINGKAFRDDPVKNPLKTASGKLEIYCQALSDQITAYGWTTVPPIPQYNRPYQGVEDTYTDWEKKIKGPYPLQLLTTHYGRRSHSVFDNILQLRRAFPQELWINTQDAGDRGIKTGDTVLVTSRWGKVLRPAYVTDRILPGVVDLGEGAWVQMDEATGIDLAGATNTLSGTTPTDCGVQPWNTNNAQVEKWNGAQLQPDYTWPQRIPIKEA